jgi:hypothetical protein
MTEDALKNLESSEELFALHRTWAGGRSLTISDGHCVRGVVREIG